MAVKHRWGSWLWDKKGSEEVRPCVRSGCDEKQVRRSGPRFGTVIKYLIGGDRPQSPCMGGGEVVEKAASKGAKQPITVAEAGRLGGTKVRDLYGREFYERIGKVGGGKVRDLIAAGKKAVEASKKGKK